MSHYRMFYEASALGLDFPEEKGTVFKRASELGIELPDELYDFIEVMIHGAKKYEANNWLKPDGKNSDHRSMHASMFRHLAESQVNSAKDHETGLDPLLHLAARALMFYTRRKRGLS